MVFILRMQNGSLKYYIFCFLLAFFCVSCDDNYRSSIPNVPVSLQLNLTAKYPTFKNSSNQFLLLETGELVYDRVGYGGILVYSGLSPDDSGNTIYYAFDMSCPYEADRNTKVYPTEDGGLGEVVCEKCGSVYDIGFGFGNPISGPSKEPLKKYHTSVSGDVLYISR